MAGTIKRKGIVALTLSAVLASAIGAGSSATGASGPGVAHAAGKKCAKKRGGASAAKKRRCKSKKQKPLVRATLTWTGAGSTDADLDLYVFSKDLAIAGEGLSSIAKSTISKDVVGASGAETFTDLAPKPLRGLSFGVCYTVGGSVHAPFTLTYVTADGQSHTENLDPGSSAQYDFPTGPPIPAGYCPTES